MATRAKLVTPEFRLSFPVIFEPKAGPDGGDPKYRIVMLYPKTVDLTPLKKLAYDAIVEKWGKEKAKWPSTLRFIDLKSYLSATGKDGWPFRDGDAQDISGYAGMISISASSKQKPGAVDRNVQPILDPNELYAGCYCRASLVAFAYDNRAKGVSFGLQNIQKVRDGEPFAGRSRAEDDFDAMPDEADNAAAYQATGSDDMFS